MTATTATRPRRPAVRRHHAIQHGLDRALLRLQGRLAAHSISLRDATTELHQLYVKEACMAAQDAARSMPPAVGDAHVAARTTFAVYEVTLDQHASAAAIALAERRFGEVLVLPGGERVGPPERAPFSWQDLV